MFYGWFTSFSSFLNIIITSLYLYLYLYDKFMNELLAAHPVDPHFSPPKKTNKQTTKHSNESLEEICLFYNRYWCKREVAKMGVVERWTQSYPMQRASVRHVGNAWEIGFYTWKVLKKVLSNYQKAATSCGKANTVEEEVKGQKYVRTPRQWDHVWEQMWMWWGWGRRMLKCRKRDFV